MAAATEIQAVSLGLGRHAYYLTVDQKIGAGEYEAISSAFSIMSLCFGKVSICLSLLRILQGAGWRKLKLALYITITVVSIVNTVVTIMTLVECHPIAKIWNPSIPGSCLNIDVQKDLAYVQGGMSIGIRNIVVDDNANMVKLYLLSLISSCHFFRFWFSGVYR